MILAGSALALLLSLYFIKTILTPYKTLIESSKQLARGSYIKVDIDSRDEVGDLARAYNKMIAAIKERDEKLRDQTEQQLGQSEKTGFSGKDGFRDRPRNQQPPDWNSNLQLDACWKISGERSLRKTCRRLWMKP